MESSAQLLSFVSLAPVKLKDGWTGPYTYYCAPNAILLDVLWCDSTGSGVWGGPVKRKKTYDSHTYTTLNRGENGISRYHPTLQFTKHQRVPQARILCRVQQRRDICVLYKFLRNSAHCTGYKKFLVWLNVFNALIGQISCQQTTFMVYLYGAKESYVVNDFEGTSDFCCISYSSIFIMLYIRLRFPTDYIPSIFNH